MKVVFAFTAVFYIFAISYHTHAAVEIVTSCNDTDAVQFMDVPGTDLQSANITCFPYNLSESFIVLIMYDPMVLSDGFMRYNLTCAANEIATAVANVNVNVTDAPPPGTVNEGSNLTTAPTSPTPISSVPSSTKSTTSPTSSSAPSDLNIVIPAATVGGGLFVIVLIIMCIVCCCYRKANKGQPSQKVPRNKETTNRPVSSIYDVINGDVINMNTLDSKKDETRTLADVRTTNETTTSPDQFDAYDGYDKLQHVHRDNRSHQFHNQGFASEVSTVSKRIPQNERSRRSPPGNDRFVQSRDKDYYYTDQIGGSSLSGESQYRNDQFARSNLRGDRSVGSRSDQYIDWTDQASGIVPMRGSNPENDQQNSADYLTLKARESTGDYMQPKQPHTYRKSDYLTPSF